MTKLTIYEAMYSVDYSEPYHGLGSAFKSQQSFTVYDWILSEKIIKGDNAEFSIRKMAPGVRSRLAFNVFPGGETVLHKLVKAIAAGTEESGAGATEDSRGRCAKAGAAIRVALGLPDLVDRRV